jgi:2-polyprenyl-3-methyl-5-hydroxy-6-metoxy-1,4-benzoquinol methylase
VRRLLGPHEAAMVSAYRRVFINLSELARALRTLAPAQDVLEVGAGDGSLASALLAANPGMNYTGIDIATTTGRMFSGNHDAAAFHTMPLSALDAGRTFDLVLLADVIHHVPAAERRELIASAWTHVRPNGALAVKEWERLPNLAHAMAFASDRYISGDRQVAFLKREELLALVTGSVGQVGKLSETRVPPRRNNLLLVLRKPAS